MGSRGVRHEAQSWNRMSNWLAIVNPYSGQYKSSGFERRWMPELRQLVDSVVCTDAAAEATKIARESKDFDGIVVVGGDGTIFEVINGMERERQHLGLIPTGRGNCLARDLGIRIVDDGFRALQSGTGICIDLMQADIDLSDDRQRIYLSASTIALGYVASVVDRASGFRAAGPYGYALATLLTRPNSFQYRLNAANRNDGERSCTGIIFNNTVHLANFPTFTDAALQDGLLDVMVLNVGWLRQALHNLSVLSGLHVYDPGERSQSKSIKLSPSSPQTLMIDGQLYPGVTELSVECLPAALWCRHIAQ